MLRLPFYFTNDEEINTYLHNYINDSLKFYLLQKIKEISAELEHSDLYPFELETLFPENFPLELIDNRMDILKALYSLFMSDKEWVPTLIMEYVLSKLIEMAETDYEMLSEATLNMEYSPYIYVVDDNFNIIGKEPNDGYEEIVDIQENPNMTISERNDAAYAWSMKNDYPDVFKEKRDNIAGFSFTDKTKEKLYKAFYDTYIEEITDSDDEKENKEYAKKYAEEKIYELWRIQDAWFEFCFWDDDYSFLDNYSVGEIRNSEWNKYAHMVSDNAKEDEYFLPEDWEHSTDFRFLNQNH